jgi:hypothetical protein
VSLGRPAAFVGVSLVVIVTPGQDTALRNTRRRLGSSFAGLRVRAICCGDRVSAARSTP